MSDKCQWCALDHPTPHEVHAVHDEGCLKHEDAAVDGPCSCGAALRLGKHDDGGDA
jgi:hypothetical protein